MCSSDLYLPAREYQGTGSEINLVMSDHHESFQSVRGVSQHQNSCGGYGFSYVGQLSASLYENFPVRTFFAHSQHFVGLVIVGIRTVGLPEEDIDDVGVDQFESFEFNLNGDESRFGQATSTERFPRAPASITRHFK